jgi:Uma2 family endonuclease
MFDEIAFLISKRGNMSVQLERRYFNVDEYSRMSEAGIFSPDDRVELIEGEILKMSPIGSLHAACVDRIVNTSLVQLAGRGVIIRVQSPIVLDNYSEPQPDISLLRSKADFYAYEHPKPVDVLMVIEVADSSVEIDRSVKIPLYAQAGIPEVVIVVLPEELVEFHAEASGGQYQKVKILQRGDYLESASIPNFRLSVDNILG